MLTDIDRMLTVLQWFNGQSINSISNIQASERNRINVYGNISLEYVLLSVVMARITNLSLFLYNCLKGTV